MMFQYSIGNLILKDFYFDNEPLLMPAGTIKIHDGTVWGLYTNNEYDTSFIVTRGLLNGNYGWRVRVIPGILSISYADSYVKQRCGECLGLR